MADRDLRRGERGSATTEAVLVTPVLLFLVMLIVQFGLWYHAQHVVRAAAQEGVRAARAEGGTDDAGAERAEAFLASAGPRIVIVGDLSAGRGAEVASVSISGEAVSVVPGFHLPVKATATSPVERFRTDVP